MAVPVTIPDLRRSVADSGGARRAPGADRWGVVRHAVAVDCCTKSILARLARPVRPTLSSNPVLGMVIPAHCLMSDLANDTVVQPDLMIVLRGSLLDLIRRVRDRRPPEPRWRRLSLAIDQTFDDRACKRRSLRPVRRSRVLARRSGAPQTVTVFSDPRDGRYRIRTDRRRATSPSPLPFPDCRSI